MCSLSGAKILIFLRYDIIYPQFYLFYCSVTLKELFLQLYKKEMNYGKS